MQSKQKHIVINNEKGIVLVVVIMLMAVLVLLGTTAIMLTTTDMKISSNYRSSSQAFYIAEAGLERARLVLKDDLNSSSTLINPTATSSGTNYGILGFGSSVSFGNGTYEVRVANFSRNGQIISWDAGNRVFVSSTGVISGSQRTIEALMRKLPPIPGGARGAVTTNYNVGILGTITVDGRDHDIDGNLIIGATSGKFGISTVGSFDQGGNGAVGGTNLSSTSYAPTAHTYEDSTVEHNAIWTPPLTPDAALGLSEGTLKAYAQSGANGSQYVTDQATLAHPQALSGVTYLELPSGTAWQSIDFGNSSGILIVHNSDRSAIVKNANGGTFKGIVIADDYVHSHNNIIGALISLSTNPSSGNVLGNGSGSILYSAAAISAAFSNWAGVKVASWHDTSIQ